MSAAKTAQSLNLLVKSRAPEDRERLLTAMVDLCAQGEGALRSSSARDMLGSIFMSLVAEAEYDIRLRLAEKLSHAEWPPIGLIHVLALDDIEIARPIIAESPLLKDADLIRVLVESTLEHQIEVARRPGIGAPVVETILSQAEPPVLTALAGNDTADISPSAMERLVEASRQIASLRSPMARHPRLTTQMAERLYMWVGQSLRTAIVNRFPVDVATLDKAMAEAVSDAHARASPYPSPHPRAAGGDQDEMEERLVAKLYAAGQLKPSYLLRALRDGKLSLFAAALTALGGFTRQDVYKAIQSDRPELLALACAAVGIDRSAFGAILSLVRDLNQGRPTGDVEGVRKTYALFGVDRTVAAKVAFRKVIALV